MLGAGEFSCWQLLSLLSLLSIVPPMHALNTSFANGTDSARFLSEVYGLNANEDLMRILVNKYEPLFGKKVKAVMENGLCEFGRDLKSAMTVSDEQNKGGTRLSCVDGNSDCAVRWWDTILVGSEDFIVEYDGKELFVCLNGSNLKYILEINVLDDYSFYRGSPKQGKGYYTFGVLKSALNSVQNARWVLGERSNLGAAFNTNDEMASSKYKKKRRREQACVLKNAHSRTSVNDFPRKWNPPSEKWSAQPPKQSKTRREWKRDVLREALCIIMHQCFFTIIPPDDSLYELARLAVKFENVEPTQPTAKNSVCTKLLDEVREVLLAMEADAQERCTGEDILCQTGMKYFKSACEYIAGPKYALKQGSLFSDNGSDDSNDETYHDMGRDEIYTKKVGNEVIPSYITISGVYDYPGVKRVICWVSEAANVLGLKVRMTNLWYHVAHV